MSKLFPVLIVVAVALGCGGTADQPAAPEVEEVVEAAPAAESAAVEHHDLLYVCNCGPECECGTVSTQPGTCECGAELVEGRMLMVDGSIASLCTCGPDCKCEIGDDPDSCGCGNPMRKVDLAGTGIYYCNCGGSCKCNFASAEPGACKCGMELITS